MPFAVFIYMANYIAALGIWIKKSTLERIRIQDNQKLLKWVLFIFRLFAAAPVQIRFQLACGLTTPSTLLIKNTAPSNRLGNSHTCIWVWIFSFHRMILNCVQKILHSVFLYICLRGSSILGDDMCYSPTSQYNKKA